MSGKSRLCRLSDDKLDAALERVQQFDYLHNEFPDDVEFDHHNGNLIFKEEEDKEEDLEIQHHTEKEIDLEFQFLKYEKQISHTKTTFTPAKEG